MCGLHDVHVESILLLAIGFAIGFSGISPPPINKCMYRLHDVHVESILLLTVRFAIGSEA
jgi:hypothetical protein